MILAGARARAESERDDALRWPGLQALPTRRRPDRRRAASRMRAGSAKTGEERLPGFVAEVLARVLEAGSMSAGLGCGQRAGAACCSSRRAGPATALAGANGFARRGPRRPCRDRLRAAVAAATLEEAQRAVAACTALQLRVLAAWLPRRRRGRPPLARCLVRAREHRGPARLPRRWRAARRRSSSGCSPPSGMPPASAQSAEELRGLLGALGLGRSRERRSAGDPARAPVRVGAAGRRPGSRSAGAGRRARPRSCSPRSCSSRGRRSILPWRRRTELGVGAGPARTTVAELRALLPRACLVGARRDRGARGALAGRAPLVANESRPRPRRWCAARAGGREVVVGAVALLALDAVRIVDGPRGRRARRSRQRRGRCSMPSADLVLPARMSRVAVVAPTDAACARRSSRWRGPAASSSSATSRPPRERRPRRCGGSTRRAPATPAVAGAPRLAAGRGGARAGGRARPARRRGRAQAARPARASSTAASRPGSAGRRRRSSSSSNERLAAGRLGGRRAAAARPGSSRRRSSGRSPSSGPSARSCRPTAPRATATSTRRRSPPSRSSSCSG